jgi:hypothetical protein
LIKYTARRGRIVGLVRHLGTVVWGRLHRGFESLPLRQESLGRLRNSLSKVFSLRRGFEPKGSGARGAARRNLFRLASSLSGLDLYSE